MIPDSSESRQRGSGLECRCSFSLSGFLLFRPMAHATIFLAERPSFRRYARSRLLRVFPAYWVALSVTVWLLYHDARSVALAAVALATPRPVPLDGSWPGRRTAPRGNSVLGAAHGASRDDPVRVHELLPRLPALSAERDDRTGLDALHRGRRSTSSSRSSFSPLIRWARRGATVHDRASRLAVVLCCLLPVGSAYLTFSGDSRSLPTWLPGYIDQFAIGMLLAVAVEVWPRVSVRRSRALLAVGVAVGVIVNLGALPPRGSEPVRERQFEPVRDGHGCCVCACSCERPHAGRADRARPDPLSATARRRRNDLVWALPLAHARDPGSRRHGGLVERLDERDPRLHRNRDDRDRLVVCD